MQLRPEAWGSQAQGCWAVRGENRMGSSSPPPAEKSNAALDGGEA